jgi:hypothetical protein
MGKVPDGISEYLDLKKYRLYYTFIPEIDLMLAQGYFLSGKPSLAVELLTAIPKTSPKTAYSAEAFYRLGDHELRDNKNEKQAKVFFDSAAAAGSLFEYARLAADRSAALGRLADLRKPADTTAKDAHYRDFMIAELFLFRLDAVDSALGHLDRIVQDPRQDSSLTMRAAYARAFIQDEFKGSKPMSDSLYRYVLEKYPHTEYAKQSERNLGLKPSVKTDEDEAHKLFLDAEASRFGGGDIRATVIPAYAKVIAERPNTREAAKAEFVIAMLYEEKAHGDEKVAGSQDSAIGAYQTLRERYPHTPYGEAAETKLSAAGIKPRPKPIAAPAPGSAPAVPSGSKTAPGSNPAPGASGTPSGSAPTGTAPASTAAPAPSTPGAPTAPATAAPGTPASPAAVPATSTESQHGRHPSEPQTSTPEPAPADTSSSQPDDKPKEELDNDYENVDQY